MALQLLPEEARKARWGKTVLSIGTPGDNDEVKLYGRVGLLEHFGFTVEDPLGDLGAIGVDRINTRKAHKRSRWLGDTVKSTVKENQAITIFYPSVRGTALPGVPIRMENLTTKEIWTFQLQGSIGVLIAALTQKTNPFDIQLWGKTGNRYGAPILKAGAPPSGGGTLAAGGAAPAPANP